MSEKAQMICHECGKLFKKTITPRTYEVKCPKCGGYDTDLDYTWEQTHGNVIKGMHIG